MDISLVARDRVMVDIIELICGQTPKGDGSRNTKTNLMLDNGNLVWALHGARSSDDANGNALVKN